MKKLSITIIAVLSLCSFTPDTTYVVKGVTINTNKLNSFCDGFKEGFEDGYCYNSIGCVTPIAPVCPVPRVTESNDYKGGYQRGFVMGQNKRQRNND